MGFLIGFGAALTAGIGIAAAWVRGLAWLADLTAGEAGGAPHPH